MFLAGVLTALALDRGLDNGVQLGNQLRRNRLRHPGERPSAYAEITSRVLNL